MRRILGCLFTLMTTAALADPIARVGDSVVLQEDIDALYGDTGTNLELYRAVAVVAVALSRHVLAQSGTGKEDAGGIGLGAAMDFLTELDGKAVEGAKSAIDEAEFASAYEAARALLPVPVPSWETAGDDVKGLFRANYAARAGHHMMCETIRESIAEQPIEWIVKEPDGWRARFLSPGKCESESGESPLTRP